jgi:hypothetical protein
MTDSTAAVPPPPAAPPPAPRGGIGLRTYLLAGCSIGGTLSASLASASEINLPFAIASAIFGAAIVLMTAAPAMAPAAPAVVASPAGGAAPATALRPGGAGAGAVSIGISAAVLSFIMNQVAQFSVGSAVFGIVGEIPADYALAATAVIALAVLLVRIPFDLLLGAYLLTRARNIYAALGVFLLAYLVCYLIEQVLSMTVGASGLYNTLTTVGIEALLPGLFFVFGVPFLSQAIGAFGSKLAAWLLRPRG